MNRNAARAYAITQRNKEIEECRLRLDDPVDGLLPELADREVLRRLDAELDDTVPAHRPITVRDLLTFRMGLGAVMAPPGTYPIQQAMDEAGLSPGPQSPSVQPDEWIKRLGDLPLAYQPGEKWLYHTGSDVLGVLMARATGRAARRARSPGAGGKIAERLPG
jgi:CubicO group peptidase (beta-lactamase class C family)